LLGGFYLAWLLQACFLQHLFDYVHVPAILLGLTVLAAYGLGAVPERRRLVGAFLLLCLIWSTPALLAQRGAAWSQCVTRGSTATVRDRVTLLHRVNWADLDRVAEFLKHEQVADGELTSFSLSTVELYDDLNVRPSTRYILLQDHLDIFVSRRPLIEAALVNSQQRFVVCDLHRFGMEKMAAALNQDGGPPDSFRWADRIAFRAGNYVVFRLDGSEMPAWLAANFER
jgi:hypothetical protein